MITKEKEEINKSYKKNQILKKKKSKESEKLKKRTNMKNKILKKI